MPISHIYHIAWSTFPFLESSCPWFRTIRTSKHLGLSACYQRQVDVVSLCQSLNLDSGLPALCWSLCGIGGSSLVRACWFQREKPPEIGYKCVSSCCCDSPQDMCGYSCKGVSWFVSLCEPVCVCWFLTKCPRLCFISQIWHSTAEKRH